MPGVFYRPIRRRKFLRTSLGMAGITATAFSTIGTARPHAREAHWALLSDTHIAGDSNEAYRGFKPYDNLRTVVPQVLATAPDGAIVNGDIARLVGESSDYRQIKDALLPLAKRIPVHMTLGNHDDRDNFRAAFTDTETMVEDQYVTVVEASPVRLILLDSLLYVNKVVGLLGKMQRSWLEMFLDSADDTPTLIFVHHTLGDGDVDLQDVDRLFGIIRPHASVKAVLHGHAHQYLYEQRDDIHLIGLPAVGYNFTDEEPVGWVDARLTKKGGDFTLRSFGGNQSKDGETMHLEWRKS